MTPRLRTATPADDLAWQEEANCLGVNTDLFFPATGETALTAHAKEVCAGCTVRQVCLDYALRNREQHGVWGGTSQRERRRILHHRAWGRT